MRKGRPVGWGRPERVWSQPPSTFLCAGSRAQSWTWGAGRLFRSRTVTCKASVSIGAGRVPGRGEALDGESREHLGTTAWGPPASLYAHASSTG